MESPEPAAVERLDPRAEDLVESLRAFGYDLATALADLVDNSITAGARNVRIAYNSDPGKAWIAVVDDGRGMSEQELREAMRFARNPRQERTEGDLGRFGLGLKTASLSQARKLSVLSRNGEGRLVARTWDVDHVAEHGQWLVLTEADEGALKIVDLLGFSGQGTVVLWRNLDRLGEGETLQRRITEAGRELSLLFHRFMEDGRITLHMGRRQLTPLDPYLRRHPATQDRGFEELEYEGYRVRVNPVVLPHPSRLSSQEARKASGPGGMLARQGFYVYRGDRLVVAGSWLGLGGMHNSAHTRLARVAVEIPPGADLAWEVDVRKSTVRPPVALEKRIIELAESVRARSEKVFTHRGTPVARPRDLREVQPVWQQVRRLGQSEYAINREHPLIAEMLDKPGGEAVEGVLRLIEATLPVQLIAQEAAVGFSGGSSHDRTPEVEEVLSTFRTMLTGLPRDPLKRRALAEALAGAEPFCRHPGLIRDVIESDSREEM
ncbi:ATP-binding protein [Thermobifida halotolerans]|uniref:ATP-binding protein n=1 Tax=Thermobifida halotolerans TaxID=483545 RepID=A0AA97LVP7_9ACTN|nr:ATP-binding protein [Thermobifida halotolerans]UOE18855.1 ATP-binding protein [Thermobifida halotolerans]